MCQGLTTRGKPCKNKGDAEYCSYHCRQRPIPFYSDCVPLSWPPAREIHSRVSDYSRLNVAFVILTLEDFQRHMRIMTTPLLDFGETRIKYYQRLTFICSTELIKLNKEVCYVDTCVQRLIEVLAVKLDSLEDPCFASYTEDFKRKCLASHRDAARKRVYSFYFKRCEDLCDDVIEKVLEYV
jgi:hypothetical protein